ncbi:unnamed protein product [Ilex paraguariensis]|uniref:HMA domain-containing protein n=1 Tax=Ilex paraguariensis TaxID=185542 RepID=A0ABC8T2Y5_9AQUA
MKTIDLFCASPASTAICTSIDQRTIVRHATRPIDRHRHHLDDRKKTRAPVPRSSQPPFDAKFRYQNSRFRSVKKSESRRKSSADILDLTSPPGSSRYLLSDTPFIDYSSNSDQVSALIPSQAVTARPQNLRSNGSLASKFSTNGSNYYPSLTTLSPLSNDSPVLKSSSTRSRPRNQVVELRVSIHCKGCEGKVRRHISRMEGK